MTDSNPYLHYDDNANDDSFDESVGAAGKYDIAADCGDENVTDCIGNDTNDKNIAPRESLDFNNFISQFLELSDENIRLLLKLGNDKLSKQFGQKIVVVFPNSSRPNRIPFGLSRLKPSSRRKSVVSVKTLDGSRTRQIT
jgi:hypothetical protein